MQTNLTIGVCEKYMRTLTICEDRIIMICAMIIVVIIYVSIR